MSQIYFDFIDVPLNSKSLELFQYLEKQVSINGGQIIKKRNIIIYEFKKNRVQSLEQLKKEMKQNNRKLNENQNLNIIAALSSKYLDLQRDNFLNWNIKNQGSIIFVKNDDSQSMMDAIEQNQFNIIFISSNLLKQTQQDFKEEILFLCKILFYLDKLLCEFSNSEIRKIIENALIFAKDPINQLEMYVSSLVLQEQAVQSRQQMQRTKTLDKIEQNENQGYKHILHHLIEQEIDSKTENWQKQINSLNQSLENIRQQVIQVKLALLKHYQLDKNIIKNQDSDEIELQLIQIANQIFGQPEEYQLQDLFLEQAIKHQYQDNLQFLEDDKLNLLINEVKTIFLKDQRALYANNYAKYMQNLLQINV